MNNIKKYIVLVFCLILTNAVMAQEGLPVYADYLTDNYYLIHPSMAGASNCNKIRLTGRKQWFDVDDAPSLQTVSINGRIGESQSGVGAILFNDKNGFHSQSGAYFTYAHHIMFSRNTVDLSMLSFGLSAGFIQYRLDETAFDEFDPILSLPPGLEQRKTEFNIDFGFSYHLYDFYAHATVKNVLDNQGINNDIRVTSNLRNFLFSVGGVFGKLKSKWSYEPSVMFQYRDATQESSFDINGKVYMKTENGKIWGGISYRRSLDGAEFLDGSIVSSQKLQYVTPLVGIDYKNFVFAYTYSYQANSIAFGNGGFHQITLGFDFGCRKVPYDCECPAINE